MEVKLETCLIAKDHLNIIQCDYLRFIYLFGPPFAIIKEEATFSVVHRNKDYILI